MRKQNKTLKVTRSIVLLLCCIIFFSSFSSVYALGLGKHNNVWENLNDSLAASKSDIYPYNSTTSGITIKSVGMDVLYGTTHGIVLYYGEVPYKETFNKDKRIEAWNGYAYQEGTSIKNNIPYWGTSIDKDEVSIQDLEDVNTSDNIKSLRLYALSVSPTQVGFWIGNIFYVIQVFFAGLGTKIISLLVTAKNIDMSTILEALGLEKLSEVVNKAFIWNSEANGGLGQLSIFAAFCILILIVSIVGYAISYAKGGKKTMDIKEVLIPVFVGLIIIGMCLSGRINTLGSALSNAVTKVTYAIAGIATDGQSGAGKVYITDVSGDPQNENKLIQIQEVSMVNKCFIDMQICTQFGVSSIDKLNLSNFPSGSSNLSYLKGIENANFNNDFGGNLGYYYWFANSNAKTKTSMNATYPATSPTAGEERMDSMITFLQASYNCAQNEGQKESIRQMMYSFAKPHTMVGAIRMFLFFIIMILLALCLWRYVKDILVAKLKMLIALLGMAVAGPLMITGKKKLVQTGKDILGIIVISFIEITIHSIMFDAILFAVGIVISPDLLRLIVTMFLLLLLWHFNKKLNEQIHKATENIERSVISSGGIVAQAKRSASTYLKDRPHRWLEERARRYDEGTNAEGKSNAGNLRSRMLHLAANTTASSNQTQSLRKITSEANAARKKSNKDFLDQKASDAAKRVKELEDSMGNKIKTINNALEEAASDKATEIINDSNQWNDSEKAIKAESYSKQIEYDQMGLELRSKDTALSDLNASYMKAHSDDFKGVKELDNIKDIESLQNHIRMNYTEGDPNSAIKLRDGKYYEKIGDKEIELGSQDDIDAASKIISSKKELTDKMAQTSQAIDDINSKFEQSVKNRTKEAALNDLSDNVFGANAAEMRKNITQAINNGSDVSGAVNLAVQDQYKTQLTDALTKQKEIADEQSDQKLDSKRIGGAKRVNEAAVEASNVATLKIEQLKAGVQMSSTEDAARLMKSVTTQTVKNNQFDMQNNEVRVATAQAGETVTNVISDLRDDAKKAVDDRNVAVRTVTKAGTMHLDHATAVPLAVAGGATKAAGVAAAGAMEAGKMVKNVVAEDIHKQNNKSAAELAQAIVAGQTAGAKADPQSANVYAEAVKNRQAEEKKRQAEEKAKKDAEAKAQKEVDRQATIRAQQDAERQRVAAAQEAARARATQTATPTSTATQVGATAAFGAASAAQPKQMPVQNVQPVQQPVQQIPVQNVTAPKPASNNVTAAQEAARARYNNGGGMPTSAATPQPTQVKPVQQMPVQNVQPVQAAPAMPTVAAAQPKVQPSMPTTAAQPTVDPVAAAKAAAQAKVDQARAAEAAKHAAEAQANAALARQQAEIAKQLEQAKAAAQVAQQTPNAIKPVDQIAREQAAQAQIRATEQQLNNITQQRQAQQPVQNTQKPLTEQQKRQQTINDENTLTKQKADERIFGKKNDE